MGTTLLTRVGIVVDPKCVDNSLKRCIQRRLLARYRNYLKVNICLAWGTQLCVCICNQHQEVMREVFKAQDDDVEVHVCIKGTLDCKHSNPKLRHAHLQVQVCNPWRHAAFHAWFKSQSHIAHNSQFRITVMAQQKPVWCWPLVQCIACGNSLHVRIL